MSAWNDFVKKIYHEGHNKDKNYSFKQALKDASARKGEMGKSSVPAAMVAKTKKVRGSRKSRKSLKKTKKSRSRRHRK
jgi:hypothetical protein